MSQARRTPLPPDVRRVVLVCGAALLLDTTFFAVLSPLLAGYAESAGLSDAGAGLLVAAYPLGFVLAAFPAGNLVARRGPRAMLVAGLAVLAASCVMFGLATSGPALVGFRFLQGVGGMLAWASAMTWAQAAAPAARRGEVAGSVLGTAVVGGILGPVVGAAATVVGAVLVFVGLALVFVVLAVLAVRLPAPPQRRSPGWRHAVGLLRDHRVRLGIWLLSLGGIVAGAINTLAPLTLAEVGLTEIATSVVFVGMAAAAAAVSPRVGRRADRHGRAVVAVVALLSGATATTLTGLVSRAGGPVPLLVALLVVGYVILEAGYVPGSALIADGTEQHEASRGEVLALANLGWALGMTVASLAAGVLVTRFSPVVPYTAVAVCALATVPEFVALARRGSSPPATLG